MVSSKKIAILVNIIAPYRIPIYQAIGSRFQTTIFSSGAEGNRSTWRDIESQLVGVEIRKSFGFVIRTKRTQKKEFFDYRFTHITPGYFTDLVSFRPDAVITNEMGFRTIAALAYGAVFGKPIWVLWGGTIHTERNLGKTKKLVRARMARWVRRWISYGRTSTEYLLSLGIPRERILQIQNCVDEGQFLEDQEPALALVPRPVILYVGQLISRKGAGLLLETAARLAAEGKKFTLLFVGEGPDREKLESQAVRLGLPNVLFHPPQPPASLPSIYRSADCLVFPTLEDVWGLVVNEALCSGLPVIASIYAGCTPEIVPPRNRFDPLDPAQFLDILRRAVEGKIEPADRSPLIPCREVAGMIIRDIDEELKVMPVPPLP